MLLPSGRVSQAPNLRTQCLFYNPSHSLRLPNEVWVYILGCLPVTGVLLCRQLCKKIKHLIDNSAQLQYPIELFATGNVDGGSSNPLSTAARLAQLREVEQGWRTLEWKAQWSEPWNGDCPNYELAGGVFARGRSTLVDASQLDGDDAHHFTAAIDVTVFSARDQNPTPVKWSHEQVGLLVHDFTIAPELDLVVLVGHRHEGAVEEPIPIHLRTISSNCPHPMATLPILFAYPQPPDVFISDFTIQIYDNLLAILFWGAHAFHLMIWDWCASELIVDYPAPAGIHFDDFTFLSNSSFLIPSSSAAGAALRIYSFAHLLSPPTSTPLGRSPHHLEFDNSGRRVAPACWTPSRPDGTVRSFHLGNYVFCVSNLEEVGATSSTAPAGLSGLSRRPELRSLLRFPKPKKEWNVGIMTCRVDPLPRSGMRSRKGKEKACEDDDETRFMPSRPFHADPDRAIIALSSGLVPVRSGVFAGVVYLDESSLAWEDGEEDEGEDGFEPEGAPDNPFSTTGLPAGMQPNTSSGDPPALTTLVPWIDLHMPPSSLPTPAEPPLMSVFDHSSASSGHAPIQIQIYDALLGDDAPGIPPHPLAPPEPVLGVAPPVPAPFVGALPPPQAVEDDPVAAVGLDDAERLYFNLFVHVHALRKFAEPVVEVDPAKVRTYQPRTYEWDDWAPPISRLLTRMPIPAWACISHGQRFATLGANSSVRTPLLGEDHNQPPLIAAPLDPNVPPDVALGGSNIERPVLILDFNPYNLRRCGNDEEAQGKNKSKLVDRRTTLPAGRYWENDVMSALPFRQVLTSEELLLSGVMIDGERVLGMKSDERGNVSSMHVMQV